MVDSVFVDIDLLAECDLSRKANYSRWYIARYLHREYPHDKEVLLLAQEIDPSRRIPKGGIPDFRELLDMIRIRYNGPHHWLLLKVIKRKDSRQRMRASNSKEALAILRFKELLFSDLTLSKSAAIDQVAAELFMSPDKVRKIPTIKNFPAHPARRKRHC